MANVIITYIPTYPPIDLSVQHTYLLQPTHLPTYLLIITYYNLSDHPPTHLPMYLIFL
jgi:hypothetical protein